MIINNLFRRDSKDKIRHVELFLNEHIAVDGTIFYSITGKTGVYQGKMIPRPFVTIDQGKVKRTVKEQAELQYNSLVSSYLDKGYKDSKSLEISNILDPTEVEQKVPKENLDQNGNKKPMLALSWECIKENVLNRVWYASAKIDGVRSLMYHKNGIIYTSSRGGKDYDVPTTYIREDPYLLSFFNQYPDVILDGELYIHGKPLSYISGITRLQNLCPKHRELSYYIYDIVDESKPFKERINILKDLAHYASLQALALDVHDMFKVVDHILVQGKDNIINLHNKYVSEGYEGLVIRDPEQVYKCGARDKRMLKIKMFQDSEFKIIGVTDGLRAEDFVFNMETKEGYPFEAKPMGDRALKMWYRENINQIIGTMATVKYFGYTTTDKPVPNLPIFKALRNETDI